jgi:hypothetical protein
MSVILLRERLFFFDIYRLPIKSIALCAVLQGVCPSISGGAATSVLFSREQQAPLNRQNSLAGPLRKPRVNADARLALCRAFAPFRARNWAAEMAEFGAIDWT